jgi:hypothetical protein
MGPAMEKAGKESQMEKETSYGISTPGEAEPAADEACYEDDCCGCCCCESEESCEL